MSTISYYLIFGVDIAKAIIYVFRKGLAYILSRATNIIAPHKMFGDPTEDVSVASTARLVKEIGNRCHFYMLVYGYFEHEDADGLTYRIKSAHVKYAIPRTAVKYVMERLIKEMEKRMNDTLTND